MYHFLLCTFLSLLFLGRAIGADNAKPAFHQMYVFGDSYSDIGEGYLDGNGPTAVAYMAEKLGFPLVQSDKQTEASQSLDFAVSGAQTGSNEGKHIGTSLLSFGMQNQVAEFGRRVKDGKIKFNPTSTLFFLAGGLNDRDLSTDATVANLSGEIRALYKTGGRRFQIALLPTAIPAFEQIGKRLNPAIEKIPAKMTAELPDIEINLSHWGTFFDEVMTKAAEYGILDTTHECAGRALFHQNATPCASPETHYYYHGGHPSTAVHKIVGAKLAEETTAASK